MNVVPTSEGTLLSTVHGRDRRSLRSIGKKDLLAAKKHGTKERSYGYQRQPRWKFTFADIVYITEDDEITEVTSYVVPLHISEVPTTADDHKAHRALTEKMKEMPSICTSHIVVVVDQSTSMKTSDVDNYRTRSDAVYATIALDYVGKQIDNRGVTNAQYTDAVTLITMREFSSVEWEREPCTNVLFNKFINMKYSTAPKGHGNFGRALDKARKVMLPDQGNETCALMLLFLSDGKPSDYLFDPYFNAGDEIYSLCRLFGPQLTVTTLGFGKPGSDFSVLETMAARACDAGAVGSFKFLDTRGDGLSTTVANLSDTMSATRQMCSLLHVKKGPRTLRVVDSEADRAPTYQFAKDTDDIRDGRWTLYTEGFNKWGWDKHRQKMKQIGAGDGVAICRLKFGIGAERMVFRLVELTKNATGQLVPTGERLVAKEGKYEEDYSKEHFHWIFCKTQRQASKLADKFNAFVEKTCRRHSIILPAVIRFLSCSVLEVPNLHPRTGFRSILVEKRLDPSKYTKWNSNNGHVAGPQRLADVLNRQLFVPEPANTAALDAILEEDSEAELSDDNDDEVVQAGMGAGMVSGRTGSVVAYCILPEHFPQAFSHHTYRYSQRTQLVCDLQGVLDTSVTPAVFELTDPVIHSECLTRKNTFGRTDHGHKGMRAFMQSHVCNDLCRMLGFADFN